jgi:hypothetical protein
MKHIATVALMLSLGAAGISAQQTPVRMMLSGTNLALGLPSIYSQAQLPTNSIQAGTVR